MNGYACRRFHAILVDNGCLRKDEAKKVLKRLREVRMAEKISSVTKRVKITSQATTTGT